MKQIKQASMWECEYCSSRITTKKLCEKHEIECKKYKQCQSKWNDKIKSLIVNDINVCNMFVAESLKEVEYAIEYGGLVYPWNDEYIHFEYPCIIAEINYHDEYQEWEDHVVEDRTYWYKYEDFISKIVKFKEMSFGGIDGDCSFSNGIIKNELEKIIIK